MRIASLNDLQKLAWDLVPECTANTFLLLDGDLGAGKTTFTKFLLQALGVTATVTSPTFVILNQYQTPRLTINHMDAYRLTKTEEHELHTEQFEGCFNVIEWYEHLAMPWDKVKYIKLQLMVIDEQTREVTIIRNEGL